MNKNHEKIIELQKFKDDFEGNIDIACKRIEKIEKELIRFEATEKERIALLNENNLLKEEIGKLYFVKKALGNAGEYGYQDTINIEKALQRRDKEILEMIDGLIK